MEAEAGLPDIAKTVLARALQVIHYPYSQQDPMSLGEFFADFFNKTGMPDLWAALGFSN